MRSDKYAKQKRIFFRAKCLQHNFVPYIKITEKDLSSEDIAQRQDILGYLDYIKVVPRT